FVVCTDAGLSSYENRLYNSMADRAFITTQSIKKLKKHIKEWTLDPTGWRLSGSNQTVNLNDLVLETDNKVYYKERWMNENSLEQKILVTFSPKYKRYQAGIREKQLKRAQNKVDNPAHLKKKRTNSP